MKFKFALFFFFFLLGVLTTLFADFERYPNSNDNADASSSALSITSPLEYKEEIGKLEKVFAQHQDASEAYAEFLNIYKEYSDSAKDSFKIHSISHWVGAQLYYQEGMSGVAICDFSFAGGCYHGFFGQAIHNEGEDPMHLTKGGKTESSRRGHHGHFP